MNKEFENNKEGLLYNKVAIITGAANGIGRGIAIGMAREGATIVIADIDREGSRVTAREIQKITEKKENFYIIHTDVSKDRQNNRLVDTVLRELGRIDILVNNVGINTKGDVIITADESEERKVFETNLIGPYFLTKRVAKEMVGGNIKGSILFTSSVHGEIIQMHTAYSMTKAAINMQVKELAAQLAGFGIRVNAVAPGAIAIRGEKDRKNRHVPLGYSGTPEDIANMMVFLASDKGSYITGQTLTVDGGFSLVSPWYWITKGKL